MHTPCKLTITKCTNNFKSKIMLNDRKIFLKVKFNCIFLYSCLKSHDIRRHVYNIQERVYITETFKQKKYEEF